jgi:Domain of unknown function (DUF927)
MTPLQFLAAVVPSAGVYCVAELSSKKKQHVFSEDIDDLEGAVDSFNTKNYDTYFALASFVEPGKRTAENALYLRSIFMDIDCGEGKAYPTKQAAAAALDAFLQESQLDKLGNPWLVSSGGGLHVYWPFTQDIPVKDWRVSAENTKRLCKKFNLAIDFTVTGDAARVLRVPGTRNWKDKKNPRTVKILNAGGTFSFADFAQSVREPLNGEAILPAVEPLLGPRPDFARDKPTTVKLIENLTTVFRTILKRTEDGSGCGQLAHYLSHASEDGMEPLWRGMLSLAQCCSDGEKAARWLSKQHPYDDLRMEQKLREIKGPYPCTKLDGENPGICTSCKHWGKITNPLALGREVLVDNTTKDIILEEASEQVSQAPAQIVLTRPTPPKGFSYGKHGGIYREVEVEDEQRNKLKKQVQVLPFDLFVVDLLSVEREHYVFMLATRPEGPVEITFQQKAVVSKDDTVKALAAQNIIASFGAGNDKNLFDYVRGCVEDASVSRLAIPVPNSYGWQPDGGFVAGGKIFMPNGTIRQIPMPGLENITHATKPRGSLEEWRKYPRMLIARRYFDSLAIGAGVGFGSPLMEFTGLYGMTFHCASQDSGTGKSVALELAASIWGHPRDYRVNKSTSPVAMQQHQGMLKNIPLLSDEITSKNRRDFEWFPEFVFDVAEGRGRDRMESGANKERVNTSVWAMMVILTSNTNAVDWMTSSRKHSSEGEMRRMLEVVWNEKLEWEPHEIEIIKSLPSNHSVAGDAYARWLSLNRGTARAVYDAVYTRVVREFEMRNDERYWTAGAVCSIAGCILAGSKYANVIDLPIEPIIQCFKKAIVEMRYKVRSNMRTAEDILNSYIREFYGKFVNLRMVDGSLTATYGGGGVIDESITRSHVSGRVERGVTPGFINFYIEEQLIKAHCASMSFEYAEFRKQLSARYRVDYMKKDMLSKTKGPQMRVNVMRISRPESEFVEEDAKDLLPVE